jgi:hypothetical protein
MILVTTIAILFATSHIALLIRGDPFRFIESREDGFIDRPILVRGALAPR